MLLTRGMGIFWPLTSPLPLLALFLVLSCTSGWSAWLQQVSLEGLAAGLVGLGCWAGLGWVHRAMFSPFSPSISCSAWTCWWR